MFMVSVNFSLPILSFTIVSPVDFSPFIFATSVDSSPPLFLASMDSSPPFSLVLLDSSLTFSTTLTYNGPSFASRSLTLRIRDLTSLVADSLPEDNCDKV